MRASTAMDLGPIPGQETKNQGMKEEKQTPGGEAGRGLPSTAPKGSGRRVPAAGTTNGNWGSLGSTAATCPGFKQEKLRAGLSFPKTLRTFWHQEVPPSPTRSPRDEGRRGTSMTPSLFMPCSDKPGPPDTSGTAPTGQGRAHLLRANRCPACQGSEGFLSHKATRESWGDGAPTTGENAQEQTTQTRHRAPDKVKGISKREHSREITKKGQSAHRNSSTLSSTWRTGASRGTGSTAGPGGTHPRRPEVLQPARRWQRWAEGPGPRCGWGPVCQGPQAETGVLATASPWKLLENGSSRMSAPGQRGGVGTGDPKRQPAWPLPSAGCTPQPHGADPPRAMVSPSCLNSVIRVLLSLSKRLPLSNR